MVVCTITWFSLWASICIIIANLLSSPVEGVDVKRVTWKNWVDESVNTNGACVVPHYPTCFMDSSRGYLACCDGNERCDESRLLHCDKRTLRCICKSGFFPNETTHGCELKNKKEPGETCTESDNCYAAFASCINGSCKCLDGFVKIKDVCKPTVYHCPYGKPLIVNNHFWACNTSSNNSTVCPKNHYCLLPYENEEEYNFTLTTASYTKLGYCCPSLKEYIEVPPRNCLFGNMLPADEEDAVCPETHYRNRYDYKCCPIPCAHHVDDVVVKNGKCTYPNMDTVNTIARSPLGTVKKATRVYVRRPHPTICIEQTWYNKELVNKNDTELLTQAYREAFPGFIDRHGNSNTTSS